MGPAKQLGDAVQGSTKVIGLDPSTGVAVGATVRVLFSSTVHPAVEPVVVTVRRADGRLVPSQAALEADGRSLDIVPSPEWPLGERLNLRLSLFEDSAGHPVQPQTVPLSFQTSNATVARTFVLRAPLPDRPAPLNLSTLTLAVAPPDASIGEVLLLSGLQRIAGQLVERDAAGLALFELPSGEGACLPLCGNAHYAIALDGFLAPSGPLGEVLTSSTTDEVAPSWTATSVEFTGDSLGVMVVASKAVRVRGTLRAATGQEVPLTHSLYPARAQRLEPEGAVVSAASYVARLEGEDECGHPLPALEIEIVTPPRIAIVINELVAYPLHRWSAGPVPFSEPVDGQPSSADQWIELVNQSDQPIDLLKTPLVVQSIGTVASETWLDHAVERFGDGGSLSGWWPGEALVVHPHGVMPHTKLVLQVVAGQTVLARLTLGKDANADHVGGRPPDFVHESIARGADGKYRWCVPTPGAPEPPADCLD
jgi:hypothetical protein